MKPISPKNSPANFPAFPALTVKQGSTVFTVSANYGLNAHSKLESLSVLPEPR
jgi:hypothetical protein